MQVCVLNVQLLFELKRDIVSCGCRLKVSCHYDINSNHAVAFHTRPRRNEPYAESGSGELQVEMRLALGTWWFEFCVYRPGLLHVGSPPFVDDSYSAFHIPDDFPIAKYLQQPLYFELQLMRSTNPELSLELERCWATLDDDRMSQPRWNLIMNR